MAFTKIVGAGIQTTTDVTVRNVQAGIITATKFIGDISEATGAAAGLGTALSQVQSSPLNKIYFTNQVLSIGSTITVDPPDSSNVAYTQYAEIAVEQGYDLIVEDGDDLVPDILGLSTVTATPLSGAGGRVRADQFTNKAGTGAPTFPNGVQVTGVSTLGNTVVGGGTTQLIVTGNARITGILTIGTSSITLDGSNNQVNVGTGVTINSSGVTVTGVITATSFSGAVTGNATGLSGTPNITVGTIGATSLNASGVVTATSFSGALTGNATGLTGTPNITVGTVTGNLTGNVNSSGVSTFSSGIVVAAGSTAAPSITPTGDSNTGIFFPSADTIAFGEGGAEAARIDSSGRFGLATTSPLSVFDCVVGASGARRLLINYDDSVITVKGSNDSSNPETLRLVADNVRFSTGTSGSGTERLRIDSSGRVGIKETSFLGNAALAIGSSGSTNNDVYLRNNGTQALNLGFVQSGLTSKGIACTTNDRINVFSNADTSTGVYLAASGTSWIGTSDERLKENLSPIQDGLLKVASLRAVTGNYINDPAKRRVPFLIAQDIETVLPEAVDSSDPDELGLSYTGVIPLLVAALKESKERIETLEAKVAALEAQ